MANVIPDFLQKPIHVGPVTLPSVLPEDNSLGKDVKASSVLKAAGWPSSLIPTALGVIHAESGGNAKAYNQTPCSKSGDHAVGWFQVCTVNCGSGGTSRDKSKCRSDLEVPAKNAKAALAVYRSQGWGAWTTYHPGITGPDFTVSNAGSVTPTIDNPAAIADSAAGATGIDALKDAVGFLSTPDSWFRIGKVALGFVIIALCLALFLFKIGVSGSPAGVASKVARKVS